MDYKGRMHTPRWPGVFAALALASGCQLESPLFVGKECTRAADCPQPLSCMVVRPEGQATCELLSGPEELALPAPTYFCAEVKTVFSTACYSCHGATPIVGTSLRLDVYRDTADGAKTYPGAKTGAAAVKARAVDRADMPPAGLTPLTRAEKAVLNAWVLNGALECLDAGTP